jgi:hypothetical protein
MFSSCFAETLLYKIEPSTSTGRSVSVGVSVRKKIGTVQEVIGVPAANTITITNT